MQADSASPAPSKKLLWTGYIISGLVFAMLIFSAVMKLLQPEDFVNEFDRLGWPVYLGVAIGILEIVCAVIYIVPQTSVLGAILLTGYLGGAVATHVRIGDPFVPPVIAGILVWVALYLRDPRLRALLPFKR